MCWLTVIYRDCYCYSKKEHRKDSGTGYLKKVGFLGENFTLLLPFLRVSIVIWMCCCKVHPPLARQLLVGQDFLVVEGSRSHSDTPHSVVLHWTGGHPFAETFTWQHTTLIRTQTSIPPVTIEPAIPASERPQTHTLDRAATGCNVNTCY
jgi:hypothetical protein